jgi:hypothetical protein
MNDEDRSSNIDYEDCGQCAHENGSGVCSNCEADGGRCEECHGSGKCQYCDGTGRKAVEPDLEERARAKAHGPLVVPDAEREPPTPDEVEAAKRYREGRMH